MIPLETEWAHGSEHHPEDPAKYRILLRLDFLEEEEKPNLTNVNTCKWDEEAEINRELYHGHQTICTLTK